MLQDSNSQQQQGAEDAGEMGDFSRYLFDMGIKGIANPIKQDSGSSRETYYRSLAGELVRNYFLAL